MWVASANGEQIAAVHSEKKANKFDGTWTGKITDENAKADKWKKYCAFDKNETINVHIRNGKVNVGLFNHKNKTIQFQTRLTKKDSFETSNTQWTPITVASRTYKSTLTISGEIEEKVLKVFYLVKYHKWNWILCWAEFELTRKPSPATEESRLTKQKKEREDEERRITTERAASKTKTKSVMQSITPASEGGGKFDGTWTGKITEENATASPTAAKDYCAFDKNETINIHIKNGEVNTELINNKNKTIKFQTKLNKKEAFETPKTQWGEIISNRNRTRKTTSSISGEIKGKVLKGFYLVNIRYGFKENPLCWGDFELTRKPSRATEEARLAKQKEEQVEEKKIKAEKLREKQEEKRKIALEKKRREQEKERQRLEQERLRKAEIAETRQKKIARIKIIQGSLKTLGLYNGLVDGELGLKTRKSIGIWQKGKRRPASDVVTSNQLAELRRDVVVHLDKQKIKRIAAEKLKKQEMAAAKRRKKEAEEKRVAAEKLKKQKKEAEEKRIAIYKTDPSTRFLFDGSEQDIVILFNESGRAKNGIRDLDGKIRFENNQVEFCGLFGTTIEKKLLGYVRSDLSKLKIDGRTLDFNLAACRNLNELDSDFIVLKRQKIPSQKFEKLKRFFAGVVDREFVRHLVFDYNLHLDKMRTQKETSRALLNSVKKGERDGYGLLITNPKTGSVCSDSDTDKKITTSVLKMLRTRDPVSLQRLLSKNIIISDRNKNFLKLKRKKCGYYLGNGKSLKVISNGLSRDRIDFSMHHDWISLSDLKRTSPDENKKVVSQKSVTTPGSTKGGKGKPGLDFRIVNMERRSEVGDGFNNFEAGSKEQIIVIRMVIENVRNKPVEIDNSVFAISLIDPLGGKHGPSELASESYSEEVGIENKLPAKFRVGAKFSIGYAFLLKRVLLAKTGWKIGLFYGKNISAFPVDFDTAKSNMKFSIPVNIQR